MNRLYLMQRFDMNEGFPNPGRNGIEPYIDVSLVLFSEEGEKILLEKPFGDAHGLSKRVAEELKKLQDKGFEISGELYPSFKKPINIEGDIEIYQPLPPCSAERELLSECGVNLKYDPVIIKNRT